MKGLNVSKYVGKQIRKYRRENNLTQKELGLKVGVKHNTISAYESGVNEPEQNMIFALANALGVSVNDLFPPTKGTGSSINKIPIGPLVKIPVVGTVKCGPNGLAFMDFVAGKEGKCYLANSPLPAPSRTAFSYGLKVFVPAMA